MSELSNFATEELQAEIERRQQERSMPQVLDDPDIKTLKKLLMEYVDERWGPHYHPDNDWKHFIFEQALISFYGHQIFEEFRNNENENWKDRLHSERVVEIQ